MGLGDQETRTEKTGRGKGSTRIHVDFTEREVCLIIGQCYAAWPSIKFKLPKSGKNPPRLWITTETCCRIIPVTIQSSTANKSGAAETLQWQRSGMTQAIKSIAWADQVGDVIQAVGRGGRGRN